MDERKFQEHLLFLENYMQHDHIQAFKEDENKDWNGNIEDTSLFYIWEKLSNGVKKPQMLIKFFTFHSSTKTSISLFHRGIPAELLMQSVDVIDVIGQQLLLGNFYDS